MTKTGLVRRRRIGHCDLSVICYLEFSVTLVLQYSNSALARLADRASFALFRLAGNRTLLLTSLCPAEQAICPTDHRPLYKQAING